MTYSMDLMELFSHMDKLTSYYIVTYQTGSGKTYTIFGPSRSYENIEDGFTINKECGNKK